MFQLRYLIFQGRSRNGSKAARDDDEDEEIEQQPPQQEAVFGRFYRDRERPMAAVLDEESFLDEPKGQFSVSS